MNPRGRPTARLGALLCVALMPMGCEADPVAGRRPAGSDEVAVAAEVGFLDLDRSEYWLGDTYLTSSPTRMFYGFAPAESPAADTPLFLLGGGGPAGSTMFLWAHHGLVAPGSDGSSPPAAVPNPWALTRLGHVLYLDARNAGYSYGWVENSGDRAARDNEFTVANYNVYEDAADTWRALLGFYGLHPALRTQPLYLLTESYGGLRVTAMLNLLLYAERYGTTDRPFDDPSLATDLRSLADAGLRIGGQILLQAVIAGGTQDRITGELYESPGSLVHQLSAETGVPFSTCADRGGICNPYANALDFLWSIDRSPYDYRRSSSWLDDHTRAVSTLATERARLGPLMGVSVAALDAVLGNRRAGAYRFAEPSQCEDCPRGDLEQTYGALEPWDAHFVAINREATNAFFDQATQVLDADPKQGIFGELFLENLRLVPTLLSRADYDLVVFGPALLPVLGSYPAVNAVTPGDREIRIDFTDGASRTIFSPLYPSSHSVCRDSTAELFGDFAEFVEESRE